MRVEKIVSNVLGNKMLLNGLEHISQHGTSFHAATALLLSGVIRPAAIYMTPETDKENKQYAISNSISSSIVKFGIVESVALPLENAVKFIDEHKEKLLNSSKKQLSPKSYNFITQCIKLSAGLITAIPKSIITVALIPLFMRYIFNNNSDKSDNSANQSNKIKELSFTGKFDQKLKEGVYKIISNDNVQMFADRFNKYDKDIAKHFIVGTDVLLTASSVAAVNLNNNIKQDRKRALNLNNIISTVVTVGLGYCLDNLLKPLNQKFIDKFSQINVKNPKLPKYIEGIHILRPAIIFGVVYYGILPMFSTFTSDKIDKYLNNHSNK